MSNYFEELNNINVSDKTEKKNNLTYLSWAFAWGELKKKHPDATYTVYENQHGWNYHTDGRYCWVKTGVTVDGIEHVEMLPVMDYKNNSIPVDKATAFDINKTIQRSVTKAIARHGLGLYIYAGEDLPDEADGTAEERQALKAEEEQAKKEMQNQISGAEAKNLRQLIAKYGADEMGILKHFKVASIEVMDKSQYAECFKMLNKKYNKDKGTIGSK